mmetsp:Transcript_2810/g.5096  ORF Transcript_2810/g.5096 Transcript_2810/m.5096 type:complete len:228 (+) Transcript_2810:45-728(+)
MGQLFAKPPPKEKVSSGKKTISDKEKAVYKLKISRDRLSKFQKKTDIHAAKLQNQAKGFLQHGQKDRALMALKIRKLKLKEVASVDLKLMDIVRMIDEIEWESQNVEVLQALEAGTAALDQLHKEMPIEEVERILEESSESIETQSQISDMISGGNFTDLDESELEAQLEALGEEETEVVSVEKQVENEELQLPDVPTTPVFPVVPSHKPAISSKINDEKESDLISA